MRNSNKAFTLIELLVVIAIIGILSSVVLASLSGARESARDTSRVQKIDQIRTALEMYHTNEGHYPKPGGGNSVGYMNMSNAEVPCGNNNNWCDLESELSQYISNLPRGERGDGNSGARIWSYKYDRNDRDMYGLQVRLENQTEASKNDGGYSDIRYEVGQLPQYCMDKYGSTSSDGNWVGWYGSNCGGGN